MNHWMQTKLYECPKCEAKYVHDKGYSHQLFKCPSRERTTRSGSVKHRSKREESTVFLAVLDQHLHVERPA